MLVVVFGKVELLGADKNWAALIDYCQQNECFIEGKELAQNL